MMSGKFRFRCHYVKNQGFQITSPIPVRRDCGGRQPHSSSSRRSSGATPTLPRAWRAPSSHVTHGGLRGRPELICLVSPQSNRRHIFRWWGTITDHHRQHFTQRKATGQGDQSTRDVPGRCENSRFTDLEEPTRFRSKTFTPKLQLSGGN